MLNNLECCAILEPCALDGRNTERWRGGEFWRLTAVKDCLLGAQVSGCGQNEHGVRDVCTNHWATLGVAARLRRPCGTTDSVTRALKRYWRTTRCTSAAVTAR